MSTGTTLGGERGVKAGDRRVDPDRPDVGPSPRRTPGATGDGAGQRNMYSGERRYRGSPTGFRARPGPRVRTGETSDKPRRRDAHVCEDVFDLLHDDAFVDADHIAVSVDRGHVVLSGYVCGEHSRDRAEALALRVAGVERVENRLQVSKRSPEP